MENKILFPNETIIITKHFSVGQDWEVPIPGFFIISSLRNIKSILDFTEDEATEFIYLLRKVRTGMKTVLKIDETYFFQNEDSKHGFHVWIFPRYKWMDSFGRKIESVKPIMNYATENLIKEENLNSVRKSVQEMSKFMSDDEKITKLNNK